MAVTMLVICTANICRSPLAAALLRGHLELRGITDEVRVTSAGVRARDGDAAALPSATIAARWGFDLSPHASQPLSDELLADAAVVLAMTEAHRDAVAMRGRGLDRRSFTLRELARLVTGVTVPDRPADLAAHIAQVVADAHARRPFSVPAGPEDIADPYGRSDAHYQQMSHELVATITPIAAALLGPIPLAAST